jgi:hypothetical protein
VPSVSPASCGCVSGTLAGHKPRLTPLAATLVAGLLIREAFSFWTGHPFDFELWVRLGYGILHGANPYGILPAVPGLSFAYSFSTVATPTISYLPFWPLVTGAVYLLYTAVGFGDRFVLYFLLKQPVILGDVLLGYLLYRFILPDSEEGAKWALRLWMFLPLTIIISGVWGTFDSLAMCFVMLSITSGALLTRSGWGALGVFAKSIPLIYVLPLLPPDRKRWPGTVLALSSVFAISGLIFLASGWGLSSIGGTLTNATQKIGESMSLWELPYFLSTLGVPTASLLPILSDLGLLWIPSVLVATILGSRRFGTRGNYALVQTMLLSTLAFLIFRAQVNEQYTIYLFALGIVDVALWHPERKRFLLLAILVVSAFLVVNNNFMIRFLAPVYPSAVDIDVAIVLQLGILRYAAKLILGTLFTLLNVRLLVLILRSPKMVSSEQEHQGEPKAGILAAVP